DQRLRVGPVGGVEDLVHGGGEQLQLVDEDEQGGLLPVTGAVTGSAPGAAAGGGEVTVDVAGRVRRPGIVVLDAGARVVDAVEAAGGARPGVDLTGLNLARVIADGEQILVGRPASPAAAPVGAAGGVPVLVNVNLAGAEELETLPEVGPVTAAAIIAWRAERGGFASVEELLEVDGIGEKTLATLRPHVTV
ncbi:ComEA family DNA-binding protein, partial [Nocardioides sp. YIM 152588]|uniref:ComEA family DNA-binding protein n=1 Tax=Nocardioides sp. YIM 152588 TaxID=3158259 RepID=UPI0032E3A198